MRPQDIQIGDYVQYNGSAYVVEEISAKGWVHLVEPRYNTRVQMTSDYIIDTLEPIVLEESMLESNGFVQEAVNGITHFVSEDRRLILTNSTHFLNSNRKWYIHIDSEDMSSIGCAELTYVHEMQHIFRFFDIDKEITLHGYKE